MKIKRNLFSKPSVRILWFKLAIFVAGVLTLGYFVHWSAPLGVFLMMWGNNKDD